MIIGMLTGAIIAAVFFIAGYYANYRLEQQKPKQEVPNKVISAITNDKGFYSYRKYMGVKSHEKDI